MRGEAVIKIKGTGKKEKLKSERRENNKKNDKNLTICEQYPLKIETVCQIFNAGLVSEFKLTFSNFKKYYTFFYILFHPHIF